MHFWNQQRIVAKSSRKTIYVIQNNSKLAINDNWGYLINGCFKIDVFQQTVVRVYYILKIILVILLKTFSILIRFLKNIAWQNMLMAQINKKLLMNYFYLCLSGTYGYHAWLFLRLIHPRGHTEKNLGPNKDFSQTFSISH